MAFLASGNTGSVATGVGIPTFSRYTDILANQGGILCSHGYCEKAAAAGYS